MELYFLDPFFVSLSGVHICEDVQQDLWQVLRFLLAVKHCLRDLLLLAHCATFFGFQIELTSFVDSKDLFPSVYTCKTPEDITIHGDIFQIRHFFETRQLHKFFKFLERNKLSHTLTKQFQHGHGPMIVRGKEHMLL